MSLRCAHLFVVVAIGVGQVSCSDPVYDDAVKAQGKETSGIPQGEFHRAGQRCTLCHSSTGSASSSPFTLAGTVFAQPARQVGVSGVEIRLTDSSGTKSPPKKTNCVGNFFFTPSEWQPTFPILVAIDKNGTGRSMESPIGRDTDCGSCHQLGIPPPDPFSQMPHIYLFSGDEPNQPNGETDCPVDPVRPGSP
jgi:hypothetical protein